MEYERLIYNESEYTHFRKGESVSEIWGLHYTRITYKQNIKSRTEEYNGLFKNSRFFISL